MAEDHAETFCGREVAAQGHGGGWLILSQTCRHLVSCSEPPPCLGLGCPLAAGHGVVPPTGDGDLRQGFPCAGAPPWGLGVPKTLRRPGALPRRKKMPHHIYPQGTPRKEIASLPEALSSQGDPGAEGRSPTELQAGQQQSQRRLPPSIPHPLPASSPLLRSVSVVSSKWPPCSPNRSKSDPLIVERSQRLRALLPSAPSVGPCAVACWLCRFPPSCGPMDSNFPEP